MNADQLPKRGALGQGAKAAVEDGRIYLGRSRYRNSGPLARSPARCPCEASYGIMAF